MGRIMKIAFILLLSLVIAHVIANKKATNAEEERCSLDSAGFVKKTIYFEDQSHLIVQEQRVALQGRPGKTGAKGQKGDVGPAGDKGEDGQTGERGFCSCAVTDERLKILQQEVENLKAVNKPKLDCLDKEGLYFDGKCFFMSKTTAQLFSDAENACIQEESQLASITSAELSNALVNFIRPKVEGRLKNIWTSGRYDPITGGNRITWGDGTTTDASETEWYPTYPSTGSSHSTRTHIYLTVPKESSIHTGFWNYHDNR